MLIKRTQTGYQATRSSDNGLDGWEGWTGGTEVHVSDRPTHSPVFGPDGFLLEYVDPPFGFVPSSKGE